MKCPECESPRTKVTVTKTRTDGTHYRRRRCPVCGYRFTTTERHVEEGSRRKNAEKKDPDSGDNNPW